MNTKLTVLFLSFSFVLPTLANGQQINQEISQRVQSPAPPLVQRKPPGVKPYQPSARPPAPPPPPPSVRNTSTNNHASYHNGNNADLNDTDVRNNVRTNVTNVVAPEQNVDIDFAPNVTSTSTSTIDFSPDIRTGDASATGGSVGDVSATGGAGGAGGQGGYVEFHEAEQIRQISPHVPFVPPAYSQPVFSPSLGLSGAGAEFQFAVMRLCAGLFGESSREKTKISEISSTPFHAPEAVVDNPHISLLEAVGLESAQGGQRFRCVALVSVEARRKRAERGHLVTLINEMSKFASANIRGSRDGLFAVLDPCISRNAGVVTGGAGLGGSSGASGFAGDAMRTILAGANAGRGRTFNVSQLGVGALFIVPTGDDGLGTFTGFDLSAVLMALAKSQRSRSN
jgi:hypothetical protein